MVSLDRGVNLDIDNLLVNLDPTNKEFYVNHLKV